MTKQERETLCALLRRYVQEHAGVETVVTAAQTVYLAAARVRGK